MIARCLCGVLAAALTLTAGSGAGSDAAASAASAARAAADTAPSTVVVDLVVRDKKNVLVSDLRAEEIELFEDGVKQAIELRPSVGGPAGPGAAPAPAPPARLVVFVFPRLEGVERDLARNAAEEFVKKQLAPGASVAVLLVGEELVPVQGFSADAAELKKAIRRAVDSGARAGDPDVRALYSLVQWLEGQPGRKTVLLFAAGLAVPPGFEETVHELAGLANQQRVSFYGVDPRGVDISEGRTGAERAGEGFSTELGATAWRGYKIGEDLRWSGAGYTSFLQGAESLAQLAQGTSGFVTERTNSFSKAMRQIAEDASGYYELRYTPTTAKPDGQLRSLEIRVSREGTRVQARQSYLVGEPAALVPAFERQLAEALAAERTPNDLELWERALHFGWDGAQLAHVLWAAVPLERVSLVEDAAAVRFEGSVSILARVKDASGAIVASFSQRFPLAGSLDQLARAHTLSIPFVRRLKLAPGDYTLEIAVQDERGDKLTVHRTPLSVRAPQGIALSSLSLCDLLPAGSATDPEDPLRIGDQRLVPNLGQPIKAGRSAMTLYSVIRPLAGSKEPAQITITLLLGGQPANRATAALPAPDASGRIAYSTAFKMDVLPPGSYRFDVAVTQGASRAEESLSFTIVP